MAYVLERPEFTAQGDKGIVGGFFDGNSSEIIGQKYEEDYVALPALKGPYGDQLWPDSQGIVQSTGNFAITNINEYPEASIRWIDYFYGEEGSRLMRLGVEGETYEIVSEGVFELHEDVINNPDGLSFPQSIGRYTTWPGGVVPQFIFEEHERARLTPQCFEGADILQPYIPDEVWRFTFSLEEQDKLSALQDDIHSYIEEMRVKFVTGDESFSNWDKFVSTVESMGLNELMEIYEAAYQRWQDS